MTQSLHGLKRFLRQSSFTTVMVWRVTGISSASLLFFTTSVTLRFPMGPRSCFRRSKAETIATFTRITQPLLLETKLKDVIENHPLNANYKIRADDVAALIEGAGTAKNALFWRDLIAGQMDADRMDYLLRDSYHAGVEYGRFDLKPNCLDCCCCERSRSRHSAAWRERRWCARGRTSGTCAIRNVYSDLLPQDPRCL